MTVLHRHGEILDILFLAGVAVVLIGLVWVLVAATRRRS